MTLFSASRPGLRGRVLIRFPARVIGVNGMTVGKASGTYTISPKYETQTTLTSIPPADLDNLFALLQNSDTGAYVRVRLDAIGGGGGGGGVSDPTLLTIAALTPTANQIIYFTGTDVAALTTLTAFARTLLDDADAATARATLGITIGSGGVQAWDAELQAIADLVSAADRLPYFTGSGAASLATFTSFARTLVDDIDAATARGTLGAQAQDADLDALAALDATAGILVRSGANAFVRRTLQAPLAGITIAN